MKIAVVTGTRAEYGLLLPLMHGIKGSPKFELQVVVTGAHLLPDFGLTVEEIHQDGFSVDARVTEITSAVDGIDVAHQVGAGISGFADAFVDLQPSAVVMLGDRYELFAAASAAFFLGIPIVHIHGGELTYGAFDDAIRHAISQLAQLHLVAAPEYRRRLIRAGAHPGTVFVTGGLGVDLISRTELLSHEALQDELDLVIREPLLLVTYHPVTLLDHDTISETRALLTALESYPNSTVVFTLPNADPDHSLIVQELERAVSDRPEWHLFSSLGNRLYLSLMAVSGAVVGNSSSGLTEAPSLGVPTVDIGPRQGGRLRASSVVSCEPETADIRRAIGTALTPDFLDACQGTLSPYGSPGAADRMLSVLEGTQFDNLKKKYYDMPYGSLEGRHSG